ncbi:MAG TPA: AAA family ATPase [Pseudonocardiaceae bacterium]
MRIAFVGKGGSGKTTLSSLFVAHLAAAGRPVLAIDADINQHLATALGATEAEAAGLPALGEHLPAVKEYLRGDNPRFESGAMIKTTPPGRGSRLLRVVEDNPVYRACVREVGGVRLAVTGPFGEDDLGVACYHSKVGAAELLLNHLVDGPGEYVVMDMTAGADSFASGLFTRFDVTALVCEPTLRSVAVYRQYLGHAREYGVRVAVLGNKVCDAEDVRFLRDHVGDDLLGWVGRSAHVRATERGEIRPIGYLEPENRTALTRLHDLLDGTTRDWDTYQSQGILFHLRNAAAWANGRAGADLAAQVDPDFSLAEAADRLLGAVPAG